MLNALDYSPIAKAGVSDLLVQRILGFVTAGQLRPGDRLPSERELAERFQVSRPTVREAMKALSILGIVDVHHGGGAFVSALNAEELLGPLSFFLNLSEVTVEKLYEARRLIEGEICAQAANLGLPADLDRLQELIAAQDAQKSYAEEYLALDSQFHQLLGEMSGNPFLARASQSLNVLGIEFRRKAANTKHTPSRSIDDHRAILKALREHDPEAARRAMVAHMDQVMTSTRNALDPLS
jgi:GntR family transcriptional regulator, transcriptional repressor for pyruvate dehydrogenase complex